jgi:hypothetical protein
MSSGKKCAREGCNFFASSSGFCSQHDPAGEPERRACREQARRDAVEHEHHLDIARNWWIAKRPRNTNGQKRYLVLGASPHEERNGRTHYNRPNVFLLGEDPPNRAGVNYRRYIQASYSSEKTDELRTIALNYENGFDEISFDWSSMCAFYEGSRSIQDRLQSFYIMLKNNGVFFLPDCNPQIEKALQNLGFETNLVRVKDLGGDTIINMLGIDKTIKILVAIKRAGGLARTTRGAAHKLKHKTRRCRNCK